MNETMTLFAVPDIACDRCRQAIEDELDQAPGVAEVRVDVRGRTVRVSHDAETAPAAGLSDRLERLGYPVAGASEVA